MLSGCITGTLGFSLKREFFSESFAFRDVSTYNYEIYSTDFSGQSAVTIQSGIVNQFAQVYSGDIRCRVFETQNSYQFPSDSLRAAKFNVSIEIKSPVNNLGGQFGELNSGYYSGVNPTFWTAYGQYLLGFQEEYTFNTNENGNREWNHGFSFGLQTGWSGANDVNGRKAFAQTIASGIFSNDQYTTFGLYTMVGEISGLANNSVFRNYWNESYDLLKNTYSFGRKRTELPFNGAGTLFNIAQTIDLGTDGITTVSEKASTVGKINFATVQSDLANYLAGAYGRCSGVYNSFYNTNVIAQDAQYSGVSIYLPLINTPLKTTRVYDSRSLAASYDVSFSNSPNVSGDGTITNQSLEFSIDPYNRVEATHSFDFTVNKLLNNSGYFTTLMSNTTGQSPAAVASYYQNNLSGVYTIYPSLNLVKNSLDWPNIKPKATAKFSYSNSPVYFVTTNGITFKMLDVEVQNKLPADIINEYKIINRPTNKSILSYGYQSERGEITVSIKSLLGKSSKQFFPDGVGSFTNLDEVGSPLSTYLQALYKFGGSVFLSNFSGTPTIALNWFLQDSKYNLNSNGDLGVQLIYTYTWKKRLAQNNP